MEVIKTLINKDISSNIFNKNDNICFLDIETTGFSRKNCIVYLVGILYFDKENDSWILIQLFSTPDKEKKLLEETYKILYSFDKIINYNGTSFDLPFLNSRLKENGLDLEIPKDKSIDIYAYIRSNKELFNLPNLKLETIEEYLGIYRDDTYSGGECIIFYEDYLLTNDKEKKDKILLHNFEDLYYLLDIVKILDEIFEKIAFNIEYDNKEYLFIIDNYRFYKSSVLIDGNIKSRSKSKLLKAIYYQDEYKVTINNDSTFEISFNTQLGYIDKINKGVFFDLNNISHKSLKNFKGQFLVPKNISKNVCLIKIDDSIVYQNLLNLSNLLIHSILD